MKTRPCLRTVLLAVTLVATVPHAAAADVKVLAARVLEPALAPLIASFERDTGNKVNVTYGATGQLRRVVYKKSGNDVLIAASHVIEDVARTGTVQDGGQRELGRAGLGVFVREGVTPPAIGTPEDLRKSLLAANSVVYSTMPSGRQFGKLVQDLGIAAELQTKTTRLPDDEAVVEQVRGGKSADIGVASTLHIMSNAGKGLRFVGRISAGSWAGETYLAAAITDGPAPAAGRALVDYLAAPAAKTRLEAAGL
jgi:molybdate transport system substrate-binding protein